MRKDSIVKCSQHKTTFFLVSVQKEGEKSDCGLNFSPRKQNSKIATKIKNTQSKSTLTAIVSFQFLKEISADLATLTPGRSLSEQIICDHESTFNHDSECGDISKTTKKKETSKLLHLILEERVVLPSHQAKGKQSTCLIKGLVVTGVRERRNMRS